MSRNRSWVLFAVLALTACADPRNSAFFVTKTSISVVDADTAPAGINFGYDREEGYIGPRFEDGSVMPVVGYLSTDGGTFDRKIRQVYATGDAALIATGASAPASSSSASSGSKPVMFFGTSTTFGLKLGFAEGTAVPNSLALGYRRKEASIVPVEKGRYTSTLAYLDNAASAPMTGASGAQVSVGISQYFATDHAAEALARLPAIRDAFSNGAEQTIAGVQKFRVEEARQGKLALDTITCMQRVPDTRLDRIWSNAEDTGVFDTASLPGTLARIRATTQAGAQRQVYVDAIGMLNADSAQHTDALNAHKEAVCWLAAHP